MSNDTAPITGQLSTDYCTAVSVGILYYDYLLTLPMEIDRFWSLSDMTWASSFFYANRYLSVLGHVPVLFEAFWTTRNPMDKVQTCRHFQHFHQYLAVAIQVIAGIIQIMRTFALYGRSRLVLGGLIGMACGVIAFGCWAILSGKHPVDTSFVMPQLGCLQSVSVAQGNRFALAWGGMLAFDVVVFLLTLYKSLKIGPTGDRTLLNILVRDGAMYFAVIALSNLSNILTFVFGPPLIKGVATTLTNVLSTTLMSRLMLNLRHPRLKHEGRSQYTTKTVSTCDNPFMSTFVEFTPSHEDRIGEEEGGTIIRDIELATSE